MNEVLLLLVLVLMLMLVLVLDARCLVMMSQLQSARCTHKSCSFVIDSLVLSPNKAHHTRTPQLVRSL